MPSVIEQRLAAQLLAGPPAGHPVAVAERLLAVQAQDPRGVRLAIRARSASTTAADVDEALSVDRSLLISWLNRGTLHLVRAEDYPWLHALTTPQLETANARRLAQEGVSPSQAALGVSTIARALAEEGPLTRGRLRDRLDGAGVPTAGQALVHVLFSACLRGLIVRGPMHRGEQSYALVRDWLGEPPRVNRDAAVAELARRFLAGHGPADERDLAKWAGVTLRDSRAGLGAIASELDERPDGLLDLARRAPAAGLPAARLLGSFEPVLLGWRSREEILGSHLPSIVQGGMFRSFALVGGRAAATWKLEDRVKIEPFGRLARKDAAALEVDAGDLMRYLGRPLTAKG